MCHWRCHTQLTVSQCFLRSLRLIDEATCTRWRFRWFTSGLFNNLNVPKSYDTNLLLRWQIWLTHFFTPLNNKQQHAKIRQNAFVCLAVRLTKIPAHLLSNCDNHLLICNWIYKTNTPKLKKKLKNDGTRGHKQWLKGINVDFFLTMNLKK